ncbi:MAG TPA: SH3-like domain-containing protein [Acidimicrobiales bacterium]|nr:SH3-like domain-containing protein [Acidimicrobiales bacterium]
MDGVHDMGGMHGFGPLTIEADEPAFHAPWEARVARLSGALVRRTTIDRFRYTIEQMPAAEYLTSSYYRRWLWAAERLADDPVVAGGSSSFPSAHIPRRAGRFAAGDAVRVANPVTPGHTRVPRYLRRAVGRVEKVALAWPNPTSSAASGTYGEAELVYTIAFAGADLFGPPADHVVTADLGESELERP